MLKKYVKEIRTMGIDEIYNHFNEIAPADSETQNQDLMFLFDDYMMMLRNVEPPEETDFENWTDDEGYIKYIIEDRIEDDDFEIKTEDEWWQAVDEIEHEVEK